MRFPPFHSNVSIDIYYCSGLVYVAISRRSRFNHRHSGILALTTFPPPLLRCCLSYTCRSCDIDVPVWAWAPHRLLMSALCPVLFFCDSLWLWQGVGATFMQEMWLLNITISLNSGKCFSLLLFKYSISRANSSRQVDHSCHNSSPVWS